MNANELKNHVKNLTYCDNELLYIQNQYNVLSSAHCLLLWNFSDTVQVNTKRLMNDTGKCVKYNLFWFKLPSGHRRELLSLLEEQIELYYTIMKQTIRNVRPFTRKSNIKLAMQQTDGVGRLISLYFLVKMI